MLENVTELPRSWRHPQFAPGDDPVIAGKATLTVWLALFAWYVHAHLGGAFLTAMSSHELTAFFANVTVPLPCVWFVPVYLDNHSYAAVSGLRKSQARFLRAEATVNSIDPEVGDDLLAILVGNRESLLKQAMDQCWQQGLECEQLDEVAQAKVFTLLDEKLN